MEDESRLAERLGRVGKSRGGRCWSGCERCVDLAFQWEEKEIDLVGTVVVVVVHGGQPEYGICETGLWVQM
jgi:hypothetical protein